MEQNKTYTTLAEAFKALSPELQAHSLRVEKYADLLFMELVAAEEYLGNTRSRVRLKSELRSLIAEAARYHDLGKVLVPAFYQWDSESYTPEEQALYRKHCADGAELMKKLVENEPGTTAERAQIIAEVAQSHHERWDGKGFPAATAEEQTAVLGRIVAVADALDHRLMDIRSESPVDDVVNALMEGSGTRFDPVLMGLLYEARRKLEKIFAQYEGQSRAIPKAMRIIRRKAKRPFWLQYRPIIRLHDHSVGALEANMCFRRGRDVISYPEMAHLLREKKDHQDLSLMFILEASDMLRRMRTCQVGGAYLALNCPEGFLKRRGSASAVAKLVQDTDMEPQGLCLIVTAEDWQSNAAGLEENCRKLAAMGFSLMLTGAAPDQIDREKLRKHCIGYCRLPAMEAKDLEAAAETLAALIEDGVQLLCDGLETYRVGEMLKELGVGMATGTLPGGYTGEDEFISGELALMKN